MILENKKFTLYYVSKTKGLKKKIKKNGGTICEIEEKPDYMVAGANRSGGKFGTAIDQGTIIVKPNFVEDWIRDQIKPNEKKYKLTNDSYERNDRAKRRRLNSEEDVGTPSPEPVPQGNALEIKTPARGSLFPLEEIDFIDYAFVNRETISYELCNFFCQQFRLDLSNKEYARLAQSFGAGKTAFAAKFRSAVSDDKWTQLEKYHGAKIVNSLKGAVYIHYDFRTTVKKPSGPCDLFSLLEYNINLLLSEATNSEFDLLSISSPHTTPIIICLDEVVSIFDKDLTIMLNKDYSRNERILSLEDIIKRLYGIENFFVIKITKTPPGEGVDQQTVKWERSNDYEKTFYLNPLRPTHIETLLAQSVQRTSNKNLISMLFSEHDDEIVKSFARKLFQYTAGCPKMVIHMLECLRKTNERLDDKEVRNKWMKLSVDKLKRKDLIPNFCNEPEKQLYCSLLMAASIGYEVPIDKTFNFQDTERTLASWLSEFNLYFIKIENSNCIRVVAGLATLHFVSKMNIIPSYWREYLQQSWHVDESTCTGSFFEMTFKRVLMVRMLYVCMNNQNTTWGQIAGGVFKNTFFEDCVVQIANKPLILTNGFSSVAKTIYPEKKIDTWAHNLPISPEAYQHLCNVLEEYCFTQPAKKSKSWDLCYVLKKRVKNLFDLIAFQLKFGDQRISFTDIQKEMDIIHELVKGLDVRVSVVVVSTSLNVQVEAAAASETGSFVLNEGDYDFQEGVLNKRDDRQLTTDGPNLRVMKSMELVIVNKIGLDKILGVGVAQKLIEERENVQGRNADILNFLNPKL
ncbi:hypothetical protein AKO1_013206 [Acrasis kona]|uniref:BRCT domain-containing protein n=1 Tax=Acrasis kona TaxID=1008807 RepID=A0AAW2YL30_9EUKA